MRNLLNDSGRFGCVLPTGIATDDTTKLFFQEVVETKSLAGLFDFENKGIFFPGVHSSYKFCLFTAGRGLRPTAETAEFVFFAHAIEDLRDPERRFTLSAEDIALLNPNTHTCPIFRSRGDSELTKAIYRRVRTLESSSQSESWSVYYMRLIDMDDHKEDIRFPFEDKGEDWETTLYESKLVHSFDHRYATFDGVSRDEMIAGQPRFTSLSEKQSPGVAITPRYFVRDDLAVELFSKYPEYKADWLLVWRDVARATDERTSIAAVIPKVLATRSNPALGFSDTPAGYLLYSMLTSFCFDYVARQKVGGIHFNWQILVQLPALTLSMFAENWQGYIKARVLELTYTARDIEPFAQDCGWSGPPFRWDEERRFLLRSELDAAFFHLYLPATPDGGWKRARRTDGAVHDETPEQFAELTEHFPTPRHAVDHIMETFPIVKRKDIETHGEYRTKRVIVEIYDAMQESIRTGQPYQTRLDPPPADPRCCHPPRETAIEIPAAATNVLPFRRVLPARADRYKTSVPLLSVKAAAGYFGEDQDVEFDDWVEIKSSLPLRKGMFVAQVVGHSMEPVIPDGTHCLFQFKAPHFKNDMIGLFQLHAAEDPETGGRFTIKRLRISTTRNRDGELQRVTTLVPDNPAFPLIPVQDEDVKFVAEFLEVLRSTVADAVDD